MSILIEPFEHAFFRNGMAVATIAGALCGLLGVYVVLRGMSYIGHGMSHAILGGAAAAAIAGVNVYLAAGAWGFASALMINRVSRRRMIGADAAIGVITTISFAVGIALISRFRVQRGLDALLWGNVLGVRDEAIAIVAGVALVVAVIVFFGYRQLLFTTFDPDVAEASGVRTARVDAVLAVMIASTIVATMNVLGVLLIAAALVIPAVVARLLTDSFSRMLLLSVGVGAVAGFAGIYLSWYLDIASGPAIVLFEGAVFIVVYAFTGARAALRLRSVGH